LKADGTVVATGDNDKGQCNVSGWRNIGPVDKEQLKKATERAKKTKRIITIAALVIAAAFILYNLQQNSVTIPDGVTVISEGEFAHKQLVDVGIPDSVTSIENNAFRRNKLTDIVIPDSVTSIGENAFARNRLTSVAIGSNVTIGSYAIGSGFEAAYNGNDMGAGTYTRADTKSVEWNVWFGNFRYQHHDGNITITGYNDYSYSREVTIPAEINGKPVTAIGDAFRNKRLASVTIPDSVKSLDVNAFADNPVTSVSIGANVKLGEDAAGGVLGPNTGFNTAYDNNNKRAGIYTRPNANTTASTAWTRKSR
jgi:hypothetical protein